MQANRKESLLVYLFQALLVAKMKEFETNNETPIFNNDERHHSLAWVCCTTGSIVFIGLQTCWQSCWCHWLWTQLSGRDGGVWGWNACTPNSHQTIRRKVVIQCVFTSRCWCTYSSAWIRQSFGKLSIREISRLSGRGLLDILSIVFDILFVFNEPYSFSHNLTAELAINLLLLPVQMLTVLPTIMHGLASSAHSQRGVIVVFISTVPAFEDWHKSVSIFQQLQLKRHCVAMLLSLFSMLLDRNIVHLSDQLIDFYQSNFKYAASTR